MPFELRSPSGLWLLSLLAPLLLLYILRIRRERKRVPSIWLWSAAERDILARHPFRRLRAEVPLVIEAMVLVCLALALSEPASRGTPVDAAYVALVVDTSASMATSVGGKTRIDQARAAALSVLRSLQPGAEAMLLDAGREPRIVAPLERDRTRLEQAIFKLGAHDVEGALGRAVAIASDHLRSRSGRSRIVVISDGALADADALSHSNLPLEFVRVGEPADNAAIIRVDATTAPDPDSKQDRVQVFAVVANFGKAPRSLFVTLTQRNVNGPLASRKLELSPGEQAPVVLSFDAAPGDAGSGLSVQLSPPDALPVDDKAFVRVPSGQRLPVVMVPPKSNPWLARALAADPAVELLGATEAGLETGDVPNDALVVITASCPRVIPGGDFVIVNPPPGTCFGTKIGEPVERPIITSWSESDPRFRFLNLEGIEILHARKLSANSSRAELVRAREGALVADISSSGRSGTLLGFDPGESTWPLKASFVLFARNLAEQARAHRAGMASGPARTGEPLRLRVPTSVSEAELESPDGQRMKLPARAGLVVAPSIDRAGFYFLTYSGGSSLVPANLTSATESDLRDRPLAMSSGAEPVASRPAEAVQTWSWLLAAVALALVAFELYWLTRRPRPGPTIFSPIRPERGAS